MLLRLEIGRKCSTFAEEILLHLLDDELLRLGSTQVQTVLVHQHFHMVHPHAPGIFRYVVVDTLTEWMTLERNFGQALQLTLKLDAEDLSRSLRDRCCWSHLEQ